MLSVANGNSVGFPEASHIEYAILKNFRGNSHIEYLPYPAPGQDFGLDRGPIVSALAEVLERDNHSHISRRGEADAGDTLAAGFNVYCEALRPYDEFFEEPVKFE